MELAGKRVLITGSARRIGAALARHLAAAGAQIAIHCNRSLPEARALSHELPGSEVVCADMNDPDCAGRIFRAAPFDVLINNASIYRRETMNDPSPEVLREYMRIHHDVPLELIRRFAAQGRSGAVVNFLDSIVLGAVPGAGAYERSRRAMADATLDCAKEYAPRIRVNAVAPGPVLPPAFLPQSRMEKSIAALPLHRAVGLDDLCAAVRFLIENESVTGAILPVDCGGHLRFPSGENGR